MTRHVFTVNPAVRSLTLVFIWSSYLTAGSDVLREQQVWVVLLSLALEAANLWLQWIHTVCRQYQVALRMWVQCWQSSPVSRISYHMIQDILKTNFPPISLVLLCKYRSSQRTHINTGDGCLSSLWLEALKIHFLVSLLYPTTNTQHTSKSDQSVTVWDK